MVIAPRAFHFGIAFGPGITVAVNISTAPHASTIAYAMGFLVQLSHDVEELVNRARSKADAKADAKEAVSPVAVELWLWGVNLWNATIARSLGATHRVHPFPATPLLPARAERKPHCAQQFRFITVNPSQLCWIRPEEFSRKIKSRANRSSTITRCLFALDPVPLESSHLRASNGAAPARRSQAVIENERGKVGKVREDFSPLGRLPCPCPPCIGQPKPKASKPSLGNVEDVEEKV